MIWTGSSVLREKNCLKNFDEETSEALTWTTKEMVRGTGFFRFGNNQIPDGVNKLKNNLMTTRCFYIVNFIECEMWSVSVR
jgi:hypothetical protein